jgi:hypothetical protein
MTRLFAPRMLKPVYEDELRRLEAYAQQQLRTTRAPS